jgi:hypothetical protein
MRVIARMLWTTVAIVFAMGFVARLLRGGQHVRRRYGWVPDDDLAAPAGGHSWGPRELPAEVQKTVGDMHYAMGQTPAAREHGPHESAAFDSTVPRDRDGLGAVLEQGEDAAAPAFGGRRGDVHG